MMQTTASAKPAPMPSRATDQLRFLLCGSVDDGKSTLLGRLLTDSSAVLDDQLSATQHESRKYGTQGEALDLALLVDGLQAEREQGITIDVAYRFFHTPRRKFVAIDAPGHEQYTRNMVTGASNAQAAIVLVDATKGPTRQTHRHCAILALMGIGHVIFAVNKMDLTDNSQARFSRLAKLCAEIAMTLNLADHTTIPVSALGGDNICTRSSAMEWYDGPTVLDQLETIPTGSETDNSVFLFPVQWVNRADATFRGYCGTVAAGSVSVGDTVNLALSGRSTTVKAVHHLAGPAESASTGQAVTLELADEIDITRGDMICGKEQTVPVVADQLAAHIIWMGEEPMLPNRRYIARFATARCDATVTDLTHTIDVETGQQTAAKKMELNQIGYCKMALDQIVPFTAYAENRTCGSFILIDRETNATVGAGMVDFALRRASNIAWHGMKIDKAARAAQNRQKGAIIWFTGLSGSGKSTIADCLEQKLFDRGHRTYLLDGDNVRHGLNRDLGFTDADRVENIRRVGEVAKLMIDAGLIVLASFISPFQQERDMVRGLVEGDEFVEVFVDTPLEICEARDVKGLYAKARAGKLKNFTGIDSEYQAPESPEVRLEGNGQEPDRLAERLLAYLEERGIAK
ncbi:MAG: adenylyl-sulfate kinase [Pseudomonadota bacterium]